MTTLNDLISFFNQNKIYVCTTSGLFQIGLHVYGETKVELLHLQYDRPIFCMNWLKVQDLRKARPPIRPPTPSQPWKYSLRTEVLDLNISAIGHPHHLLPYSYFRCLLFPFFDMSPSSITFCSFTGLVHRLRPPTELLNIHLKRKSYWL
jgi:hypothetical protein